SVVGFHALVGRVAVRIRWGRMAHSHWGDFQSLITLSIAINAAFAAVPTFLGRSMQKQRQLVEDYISEAVDLEGQGVRANPRTLSSRFIDIETEYKKIEDRLER